MIIINILLIYCYLLSKFDLFDLHLMVGLLWIVRTSIDNEWIFQKKKNWSKEWNKYNRISQFNEQVAKSICFLFQLLATCKSLFFSRVFVFRLVRSIKIENTISAVAGNIVRASKSQSILAAAHVGLRKYWHNVYDLLLLLLLCVYCVCVYLLFGMWFSCACVCARCLSCQWTVIRNH